MQIIEVTDEEFDALNKGKQDFALEISCGSCIPEKGDGIIFMMRGWEDEPAAYVVVDVTYAGKKKVVEMPPHLFKEYMISAPSASIDEEAVYVVFEINADLTLMANGVDPENDNI